MNRLLTFCIYLFGQCIPRGGLPILMYDRVSESSDAGVVRPEIFDSHMHLLHARGWQTLTLEQLYNFLYKEEPLPSKSFLVLFNEGYADTIEYVKPLLDSYRFTASVFVTTSWIGEKGTGEDGNDIEYLDKDMLKKLTESNWTIASKLHRGRNVGLLSEPEVTSEFHRASEELKDIDAAPHVLSLHGTIDNRVRRALKKAGASMIFSKRGLMPSHAKPFALPVLHLTNEDSGYAFLAKMTPLYYRVFK